MIFIVILAGPLQAQNTKGDRPSRGDKPVSARENRFKKPFKSGQKEKPGKRLKSKRRTDASQRAYVPRKRSRGGERAGHAIRPTYHDTKPSNKQRAWKGDIS